MKFDAYEHLKEWEGLRLDAYQDIGGVWTIGYGSTGPHVKPGMRITEDEAKRLLDADLVRFEKVVNDSVKVPINQNQYNALVSLAFNIGTAAFLRSTVLRRLNAGAYQGAADAILMWNKVKGKKVKGLVNRRESERKLFLTPVETEETEDLFDRAIKELTNEFVKNLIRLIRK